MFLRFSSEAASFDLDGGGTLIGVFGNARLRPHLAKTSAVRSDPEESLAANKVALRVCSPQLLALIDSPSTQQDGQSGGPNNRENLRHSIKFNHQN